MSPLGTAAGDEQVLARLIVGHYQTWGVNKLARRSEPVYVLRKPNIATLEHAEGGALNAAALRSIPTKGRRATLVTDVDPCDYCGRDGGVNSLAWQLGISELEIVSPAGRRFLKVYEPGTL
ncbi:MAG: deaminase [Pirellulaceae bacterium]